MRVVTSRAPRSTRCRRQHSRACARLSSLFCGLRQESKPCTRFSSTHMRQAQQLADPRPCTRGLPTLARLSFETCLCMVCTCTGVAAMGSCGRTDKPGLVFLSGIFSLQKPQFLKIRRSLALRGKTRPRQSPTPVYGRRKYRLYGLIYFYAGICPHS